MRPQPDGSVSAADIRQATGGRDERILRGGSMKILIVDDDDALVAFLAKELEARGCEILQTHFGDGGLKLYNRYAPFEFVLSDYRFIPGAQIKDGVELVTAIHGIDPHQRMALMTAAPE